nr:hypothetical protein [uncultured Mediterranean phage uvMED]BAR27674.1 hypothetical protein [uncultured Mediterranean phage uvMED]|tara:strand:+ start:2341 stop:3474 length:1134 start_codon:yes stop_codon:yes gene_type:complete
MPAATYGYLASIVPAKKTRTLLHVAPTDKLVEGRLSISHQNSVPVRVRVGVSSGALTSFAPSNYILYDLVIDQGETYETDLIYFANNQSLVVYTDAENTSFLLHGEVVDNPVTSGFLNSIKVQTARKDTVLYTVPGTEEVDLSIFVSNQGSSRSRFRISIQEVGQPRNSANYLNYNTVLYPRSFYQRTNIKAAGGQQVVIWVEDANQLSFAIYGKFNYNVVATDFSVNGNFTVVGDSDLQSDVTVGQDLTVGGTSTLTGPVTTGSSLHAGGTFSLGADPLAPVASITDAGIFTTSGSASIGGGASITGTLSSGSGNFTVDSSGNATLSGNLSAGGVSSDLNLLNNRVTNMGRPIAPTDAATRGFVDAQITALSIALS